MEAKAMAKYVRISPRKMRRSVDLIRGQHVEDARRILTFSPYKANRTLIKVLNSAVANARPSRRTWWSPGPGWTRGRP
jgi:large subunit ribosomal protein L22